MATAGGTDPDNYSLAQFADETLREFATYGRPSEAGPSCRRFIEMVGSSLDGDEYPEKVRHGEDQIVAALFTILALGEPEHLLHRRSSTSWPILVAYGTHDDPRYALYIQEPWEVGIGAVRYLLDPSSFERGIRRFASIAVIDPFWAGLLDQLQSACFELLKYWGATNLIRAPRIGRLPTAGAPRPAIAVTVPGAAASIGVAGKSHGRAVATTVAHLVAGHSAVTLSGVSCSVLDIDYAQDAAIIDTSAIHVPTAHVAGVLSSLAPRSGVSHDFEGSASGAGSDVVVGWDVGIPWMTSLPVQSHVYTGCITQPGDSGAALISPSNKVVGFAQFSSPAATHSFSPQSKLPGISGWVWADAVYRSFSIA